MLRIIKSKKGFTLIELIVVLAVLGIIALISIPRYLTVQEKTRLHSDYATVASIAKSAELHYAKTNSSLDTIAYSALEATDVINENIKLQSKDYKTVTLDDDSVTINVVSGTGNVVEVYINGDKLYPPPE